MNNYDYHRLKVQLAILQDVAKDYPTSSISNAMSQIEARIKLFEAKRQQEQKQ
jgi:hypothetical protein